VTDSDLYLLKVDAVAGAGCKYELGREVRLLVVCTAASPEEASAAALTPLAVAGWTRPEILRVASLANDPAGLDGAVGDAARYALAHGYAIVAYP